MSREIVERAESERGAVLVLVALTLTILLVAAGLAVDLSALENRGQDLQNAADAASLAGAAEWVETGDPASTRVLVDEVIAANGIGPEVLREVTFLDNAEISVALVDESPGMLFGSIVGVGGSVERDASARQTTCSADCAWEVEIPPPFGAFSEVGSGDGFIPIVVDDRLYAINHEGDRIMCFDRSTQSQCWGSIDAAAHPIAAVTDMLPHAIVHDDRIWWLGQSATALHLFCWELATDTMCPTYETIALLESAEPYTGDAERASRGGALVEVDGRAYVFTDDHTAHCVELATGARCAEFGTSGLSTELGNVIPALDVTLLQGGWQLDRIVDPAGRIFYTMQVVGDPADPEVGTWVDCWDTNSESICTAWTPHKMFATGHRHEGRLFFHRDGVGVPQGVCATGVAELACVDFNGNQDASLEADLAPIASILPAPVDYVEHQAHGVHTWHEASNRLIMTTPRALSRILCWDFDSASMCGDAVINLPGHGPTQDYGFVNAGECLFGLGHTSVFWSLTPDLTPGCDVTGVTETVTPCVCATSIEWGPVLFDDINLAQWDRFEVRIEDSTGGLVLPDDGSSHFDLVDSGVTEIDLSGVPIALGELQVVVVAEASAGEDPWAPGSVTFGIGRPPSLVLTE